MEAIIKTEKMEKTYNPYGPNPKKALSDISLEIEKGSFTCIMGTSGSGKTTLINVLSTIDEATGGAVYLMNQDLRTLTENQKADIRKKQIGFIFQDYNLIDSLTIKENILFSLKLNQKKNNIDDQKITEIVTSLEIDDILDKYPYECSGGQQQRAAIARALVTNPTILFADEPTGNLDSIRAKQLMEYLAMINQKYGITIIMVTHDCLIASYSSKMLYVEDGHIVNHLEKGNDTFEQYYSKIAKITMKIDL